MLIFSYTNNKNKQPGLTMTEIIRQQQLQAGETATKGVGTYLAELRRSGAAGGHDSRRRGNRTRHDQRRSAIHDSREN